MSEYMPKVGDRVRAVLGENLLVGVIQEDYVREVPGHGSDQGFLLGFGLAEVWAWERDGWHFEQVVSVPSKFGAVIRRADGEVFTHVPGRGDGLPGYDWYSRGDRWRVDNAIEGGFTVLFDGVDE